MRKLVRGPLVAALWLAAAPLALATDPWEAGGDDTAGTTNILRHADVQFGHDLEDTAAVLDRDWMVMVTKLRHSYEVRVGSLFWQAECSAPICFGRVARVNGSGVSLTEGFAGNEDFTQSGGSVGRTIRWIATGADADYLIGTALSATGASPYDVALSTPPCSCRAGTTRPPRPRSCSSRTRRTSPSPAPCTSTTAAARCWRRSRSACRSTGCR